MLEQAAHRGDAAVHRGRGCSRRADRHDLGGGLAAHALLPVQIVEQVGGPHLVELKRARFKEAREVRQVEGVRPNGRRRVVPDLEMSEEAVDSHCRGVDTGEPVPPLDSDHRSAHVTPLPSSIHPVCLKVVLHLRLPNQRQPGPVNG